MSLCQSFSYIWKKEDQRESDQFTKAFDYSGVPKGLAGTDKLGWERI